MPSNNSFVFKRRHMQQSMCIIILRNSFKNFKIIVLVNDTRSFLLDIFKLCFIFDKQVFEEILVVFFIFVATLTHKKALNGMKKTQCEIKVCVT